jgi:hypothetical protein
MMLKLDRDQMMAELAALDALLSSLPVNDFLGRRGLESRRREIAERLEKLTGKSERRAQVALYFGGDPVVGSMGIQAGFTTNALGSFQDLVSKVWGEAESGQLAPMGPVRDRGASQLHITSLVHGSFGFLLEELDERGEPLFETALSRAAGQVVRYIDDFASEDERVFSEAIEQMDPRVFLSLREFFAHVYRGKATFRMVEGDRDERFDHLAVERAWRRSEESSVDENRVWVEGRLLGVIPVRRRFEFEQDGGTAIIEGPIGEKFGQSYLERMSTEQFAGRRWRALLHRRLVTKVRRRPTEMFTLLELEEIAPSAQAASS